MSAAQTLKAVIRDLRSLLARLERFAGNAAPLDEVLLDALADLGGAATSTNKLAALAHRRRADVGRTLLLLERAGQVRHTARGWVLV